MTAILRQALGQDPAIDLDGLADALADMILADRSPEGRVRRNAAAALRWASSTTTTDYGGTPHAKSLDALVRVYETRVAQVLATTWCVAGHALYSEIVDDAREEDARRRGFSGVWIVNDGEVPPLPPGLDEAAARWFRLCY